MIALQDSGKKREEVVNQHVVIHFHAQAASGLQEELFHDVILFKVFFENLLEFVGFLFSVFMGWGSPEFDPCLEKWVVGQVGSGNEHNTTARYSGWRRIVQILWLEDELDVVSHGNAIVVSQSEESVVI